MLGKAERFRRQIPYPRRGRGTFKRRGGNPVKRPKIHQPKIPSTKMGLPKIPPPGLSVELAGRKSGGRTEVHTSRGPPGSWPCHSQSQPHTFVLGLSILLLVNRHFVHVNVLLIRTCRGRTEDTAWCDSICRETRSPRDIVICLGSRKKRNIFELIERVHYREVDRYPREGEPSYY